MKNTLFLSLVLFLTACASQPVPYFQQADSVKRSDYKTFSIKPVVVKSNSQVTTGTVEVAIRYALEKQGLIYDKDSKELLVEYAVGIKSVKELEFKYVPVGAGVYTGHTMKDAKYVTLVMNIQDLVQQKSVWTWSGSRKVEELKRTQQDVNNKFVELLNNFK